MQRELYVEKSIVKPLEKPIKVCYTHSAHYAGVMELADVPDSKSGGSDTVRVRPPPPAPNHPNKKDDCFCNRLFYQSRQRRYGIAARGLYPLD